MYRIIGAGAGAGAAAGIAAFIYERLQIAPLINRAGDYEEMRSHALAALTGEHEHEHEAFGRAVQENIGAAVGVVTFGVIVGILFAVAYTVLSTVLARRTGRIDARWTAAALGAGAFVAVSLVPLVVLPANPPGVGQHDTAGARTVAYVTLLVISVTAAALLAAAALRWTRRFGTWTAGMCAGWCYLAVVGVTAALLPRVDEVPTTLTDASGAILAPGFPADVLAEFRMQTIVTAAVMWLVLSTVFAAALPRTRTTSVGEGLARAAR